MKEQWSQNVRTLKPLHPGDTLYIQNQTGNNPLRWNKTGVVLMSEGYDQYKVMVDGSRRITLRNQKFRRKMEHTRVRYLPPIVDHSQPELPKGTVVVPPEDEEFYTPEQIPMKTYMKQLIMKLNLFMNRKGMLNLIRLLMNRIQKLKKKLFCQGDQEELIRARPQGTRIMSCTTLKLP